MRHSNESYEVLLIMRDMEVLTFEFVNEILKCGHSNESSQYFHVVLLTFLFLTVKM